MNRWSIFFFLFFFFLKSVLDEIIVIIIIIITGEGPENEVLGSFTRWLNGQAFLSERLEDRGIGWRSGGSVVCLLVGCLTSQQQASVSQGRICSDKFTCCHT